MFKNKIIYCLKYRINKLNSSLIKGKKNIITKKPSINELIVEILGNNNSLKISKSARIFNVLFPQKGNNNKILISDNLWVGNNSIILKDTIIRSGSITECNSFITIVVACYNIFLVEYLKRIKRIFLLTRER